MSDNVVSMTVKPKEVITNIGRHKLLLAFRPDEPAPLQWSWLLRVTRTYEYTGMGSDIDQCKAAAQMYAKFHDDAENAR